MPSNQFDRKSTKMNRKSFRMRRRTVSSCDPPPTTLNKEHWNLMSDRFCNLLATKRLYDIRLKIENETFCAHKVLLAAAAPYFEIMFSKGFVEGKKDHTDLIEIGGISANTFRIIFNFIYKAELDLNEDNIQEIIAACGLFQMEFLMGICVDFLKKRFDKTTCFCVYRLMELYSFCPKSHMLRIESKKFIETRFGEVVRGEDFLDLPKDIFESLLRSEGLLISSELVVLMSALRWLMHDVDNRFQHMDSLMQLIRMPTIPVSMVNRVFRQIQNKQVKEKLADWIQKDEEERIRRCSIETLVETNQNGCNSIKSNENSMGDQKQEDTSGLDETDCQLVAATKKKTTTAENKENISHSPATFNSDLRWRPRMACQKSIYIVGGLVCSRSVNDENNLLLEEPSPLVDKFDCIKLVWNKTRQMNVPRYSHQAVEMDGLLYVAGGFFPHPEGPDRGMTKTNSVEVFDPSLNEWKMLKSMRHERGNFLMVAFEGFLYVFGGSDQPDAMTERYDPVSNEWKDFSPFNNDWKNFNGVVYKNQVILAGGQELGRCLNDVKSFNLHTKTWTLMKPMLTCRSELTMTTLHDHIYVAGGNKYDVDNLTIERYSFHDQKWEGICGMGYTMILGNIFQLNHKVMAMVRSQPNGYPIRYIYCLAVYDPEVNIWRLSHKVPAPRNDPAVVVV